MPIWVHLILASMLTDIYAYICELNRNNYFKSQFVPICIQSILKIIFLKLMQPFV